MGQLERQTPLLKDKGDLQDMQVLADPEQVLHWLLHNWQRLSDVAVHEARTYSLEAHCVQFEQTGLEELVHEPLRYWPVEQLVVHGEHTRLEVDRHGDVS